MLEPEAEWTWELHGGKRRTASMSCRRRYRYQGEGIGRRGRVPVPELSEAGSRELPAITQGFVVKWTVDPSSSRRVA